MSTVSNAPQIMMTDLENEDDEGSKKKRKVRYAPSTGGNKAQGETWGNEIEFLFSCISLSVGLGNVWRFPFIAFQNGGGTFVIPYLIVLLLIGRPVYYLEIIIGQFSGRGCIKSFNFSPVMKGVACGQVMATGFSLTYYSSIMALTLRFLIASFSTVLPYSYCWPEWGVECLDDVMNPQLANMTNLTTVTGKSPAELYFLKEVLKEKSSIQDGIGYPEWSLVGCLLLSWVIISIVLIKGIKSSGKASYFLGIFPYIILILLLIRAVTLPGAIDGIIYFFKPQWDQLLNPLVWYAAVTQVFFSLAICFGTLITYASYNNFNRDVKKDLSIITTMDLFASITSGCITFGILGNLAAQTNAKDIATVVQGGAGLAFISYPDAISKFEFFPQIFAVLFFLMLFVLGVGSTVGMASCIIRVIRDQFTALPSWILTVFVGLIGFFVSLVYITPGGQFVLNLVDFFGVSFTGLVFAIGELVAVAWIYGVKRFCDDIYFMTGQKTGYYWRICWGILSPVMMIGVLIYFLVDLKELTYKDVKYPNSALTIGWTITTIALLQLPIWAIYSFFTQRYPGRDKFKDKFLQMWKPIRFWGPADPALNEEYLYYRSKIEHDEEV
ncbi:hypothetical protein ACFFRR_008475 [Megaselia abdita]